MAKVTKENVVRGSYSLPQSEQDQLELLPARFTQVKPLLNKSEIIRIGITLVAELDELSLRGKLDQVRKPKIKSENANEKILDRSLEDQEYQVSDKQWKYVEKVLGVEVKKVGKPRNNSRLTINGILFVFRKNKQRRALPEQLSSFVTCWRRLKEWQQQGIWKRICQTLLDNEPDETQKMCLSKILLKTLLTEIDNNLN